jgi:hypothetical protein
MPPSLTFSTVQTENTTVNVTVISDKKVAIFGHEWAISGKKKGYFWSKPSRRIVYEQKFRVKIGNFEFRRYYPQKLPMWNCIFVRKCSKIF